MVFISCSDYIIITVLGIKTEYCCTKSESPQLIDKEIQDFLTKHYFADKGQSHHKGAGSCTGLVERAAIQQVYSIPLSLFQLAEGAQQPASEIKRVYCTLMTTPAGKFRAGRSVCREGWMAQALPMKVTNSPGTRAQPQPLVTTSS